MWASSPTAGTRGAVRIGRGVEDAAPYGCNAENATHNDGGLGGSPPYGSVTRGAARWDDVGIVPYAPFADRIP